MPYTLPIPTGGPLSRAAGLVGIATAAVGNESFTAVASLIGVCVVAALGLAGAVWTASSALRASIHTNKQAADKLALDRDAAHDARVEAENTRLRAELDTARSNAEHAADRYRELQERHARLRLAVISHDLDPDQIIAPRTPKENGDATTPAA